MTVVDWTKPVETDETAPRPVRVLCTDRKARYDYPVVALVADSNGKETLLVAKMDGTGDHGGPSLRNVAAKPREIWVNESSDGLSYGAYTTRKEAEHYRYTRGGDVRRTIRFVEAPDEPAPADDGWIPWHGGECPVSAEALVDVKLRSNVVASGYACDFLSWGWQYPAQPGEIVAYRLSERGK